MCICRYGETKIISYDIVTKEKEDLITLPSRDVPFYYDGEMLLHYYEGKIYKDDLAIKDVDLIEEGKEHKKREKSLQSEDYIHQYYFDYIDSNLYCFDLTTF